MDKVSKFQVLQADISRVRAGLLIQMIFKRSKILIVGPSSLPF